MKLGISIIRTGLVAVTMAVATPAIAQSSSPLKKVRYEEAIRSLMYVPAYAALANSYFKDEGLDVSMKVSQGTDKGMAALLSGSADIVLIGPEPTVYVQTSESSLKTRIFAGNTATDGYMLLARQKDDNFDWAKLKGKELMTWRPGSAPDIFVQTLLKQKGMSTHDVTLVNNVAATARVGAWLAGKADYAIFPEPDASILERDGAGYVMASIGHEVGPVDYTVYTATVPYIEKNPDVIQAWTNAIAKGMEYAQNTSSEEIAKTVAPFFPGMELPLIQSSVERYKRYGIWKTSPLVEESAMEQLQDMLIDANVLDANKRVPYGNIVYTQAAKNVRR